MDRSGSLLGGILLIGGSCIGAGVLGLPIVTGLSGFLPSLSMFFAAWAFMTITGLLLVEVNGWFPGRVNMISMVGKSLGKSGKVACWILYLFLFYALLVAYIAGFGSLSTTLALQYFHLTLPNWMGSLLLVLLFGIIVYFGTRPVDLWNRLLMLGKIGAFLAIVFLGARYVQSDLLLRSQPQYLLFSLPILVISFGFHNLIPSLMNYMHGNIKRVRLSIIFGGLFALVLYLLWQIIVLGIVPADGPSGIIDTLKTGKEASQSLIGILGISWVSTFANLFAFFAILTSFMAQSLALSHFLADGMNSTYKKHEDIWILFLVFLPPLFCSLLYPGIFIKALNFAGGICAVILFGVLPILMVWRGRYRKEIESKYQVFGGRPLLILIFLFALLVTFFQLSSMFNAPYLPSL